VRTIHKYEIYGMPGSHILDMPTGAEVIHFGTQEASLRIWAVVNDLEPLRPRTFVLAFTGQPIPSMHRHLGTVQLGPHVYHLFEEDRK
jgi:hypothetical protein